MLSKVHSHHSSTLMLNRQSQSFGAHRHPYPMAPGTLKILASNLKRLRLEAKLNQTELGKKAGVAQTLISQLENALDEEKKSPTLTTIDKLATAFGVPAWTLLVDTDGASPSRLKSLDAVVSAYTKLSEEGQIAVDRIVEMESRYSITRSR